MRRTLFMDLEAGDAMSQGKDGDTDDDDDDVYSCDDSYDEERAQQRSQQQPINGPLLDIFGNASARAPAPLRTIEDESSAYKSRDIANIDIPELPSDVCGWTRG